MLAPSPSVLRLFPHLFPRFAFAARCCRPSLASHACQHFNHTAQRGHAAPAEPSAVGIVGAAFFKAARQFAQFPFAQGRTRAGAHRYFPGE